MFKVEGRLTITTLPPRVRPADPDEMAWLLERGHARVSGVYRNKLVDLGLSAISRLIGFGLNTPNVTNGVDSIGVVDINDLQISEMRFGNLDSPTAPAAGDNSLEDTTLLYTDSSPTVTYPGNATVRWSGIIPATGYTGEQVTEEGLFLSNGALFARTTFAAEIMLPAQAKQMDHSFTVSEV